jgi:DNA-binding transcriptional regulator LsrR (DeoR family)
VQFAGPEFRIREFDLSRLRRCFASRAAPVLIGSFTVHNISDDHLVTIAARMYHEQQRTQREIANSLNVSQVTVCRLLKRAEKRDIVRTTVSPPVGTFVDLEGAAAVLVQDPHVRETMALIDIGSLEPSSWLVGSGNTISPDELQSLQDKGGVGNICLRFYNARGEEIEDVIGEREFCTQSFQSRLTGILLKPSGVVYNYL